MLSETSIGSTLRNLALIFAAAVAINSRAAGQSPDTTRLNTVVVSATKAGIPGAPLTQAVTVISGDDLRARGVTRVTDALREVPGASLVQSGSFGSVTSLFLRGGESRYTKVLIDGVPVNAPGGFFDLSHLTTDNIDRIEVVRGPASVLYGADAVSGVVQIFTRKAGMGSDARASVRGGTYGTRDGEADFSGGTRRAGATLGVGDHATNGIVSFNNQYYNRTLSSSAHWSAAGIGDASLSARYTAADYHYPTDFTGAPVDTNSHRVQHRLTLGLDASRALSAAAQARILLGSNDVSDITEDVATPFGAKAPAHSIFDSKGLRRTAEARVSYFLPFSATLTSGAEYQVERERSGNRSGAIGASPAPTDGFVAERHNTAYYSELLGTIARRLSYNLSGRLDDNSDYGNVGTYRAGTSLDIAAGIRARGFLATAFNAPAFDQLRATLFTVASPNLQPERSRSWEGGLERTWTPYELRLSADVFTQRFSQLIQFVNGTAPTFLGSFANLTAASSNGYEFEAAAAPLRSLRASASYTVDMPKVTSVPPGFAGSQQVGDELVRRPTHSGSVALAFTGLPAGSISAVGTYVGKRPDIDFSRFPSPTLTLPAYLKLDLSGQQRVGTLGNGGNVALTVRIENALDKKYQDVLGFPAPGRVFLVGGVLTGH